MKKTITFLALASVTAVSLSACTIGANGNENDKRETKSFSTCADGKKQKVLPSWIPDSATDIKEVIRTTGSERIITMKNGTPPSSCTTIPAGKTALCGDDAESSQKAEDFSADAPSLTADWWPVEIEKNATVLCGKWLVTVEGNNTYAFSPEIKAVKSLISGNAKK
ncbi:lipoprotein, putative [Renibacterium salmoninarum ATCC 33209]|uniref:Lipoprotein, putative n=1 Tax=Renibacterium salmoninarum (strain ATCC 33209 / DSM 20767 / JCM 11484 / NBRC 15589 / NCIMB 2235) TaxID=288705 RepID=A9WUK2_RENSM|nr:hypothetical protein [Renibacterium salmoninarum]ABY24873.1 lipoprotein, putative [Renibacterium salmoninarum ATCC 33209]